MANDKKSGTKQLAEAITVREPAPQEEQVLFVADLESGHTLAALVDAMATVGLDSSDILEVLGRFEANCSATLRQ